MRAAVVRRVLLAAAALVLVLGAASASAAGAPSRAVRVPAGFFGVVPQAAPAESDWARIGALGLTDRFQVVWADVEPSRGHYEWSGLDATVAAAAERGVRLLPVLFGSPAWVEPGVNVGPTGAKALGAWRGFLTALVRRYGPRGSFWRGRPRRLPIRPWP